MRRGHRLAAGLGCLALVAGCGSDAPVAKRSDFVGIVTEDVFGGDDDYRDATLRKQAEAGIGLIRQTFDWSRIEVAPGEYDFSAYDGWMEKLAEQRMRVLPIVFNPPAFHSSKPAKGARRGTYPPRNPREIEGVATALAKRYGPGGSFWHNHGDLPETPIRSWQIWNEPNLTVYWPSGPNPAAYVELLKAAGDAIRKVDPQAEIVTAGLPNSRKGVPFHDYLEGMLDAGAGDVADVFGLHPYATDVGGVVNAIRSVRRALREHRVDAPIWITEIGWATEGPKSAFTVGMRGQADRIRRFLGRVAQLRNPLGIRGVVYYDWRDAAPFQGGFDFFGLHTGLLTQGGVDKPGLQAFERGAAPLAQ